MDWILTQPVMEEALRGLGGLAAVKALESWPARALSPVERETELECRQAIASRLNAVLGQPSEAFGEEQVKEVEDLSCAFCVLIARLRAIADDEEKVSQIEQAMDEIQGATAYAEQESCLTWHPVWENSDAGFALSAIWTVTWTVGKLAGSTQQGSFSSNSKFMQKDHSRFPVEDPPAEEVRRFRSYLATAVTILRDPARHWSIRMSAAMACHRYVNLTGEAHQMTLFFQTDPPAAIACVAYIDRAFPHGSEPCCLWQADHAFTWCGWFAFFNVISGVQRLSVTKRDPKLFENFALALARGGFTALCVRWLRSFASLLESDTRGASYAVPFAAIGLQMCSVAAPDGKVVRAVLDHTTPMELRKVLIFAVEHGARCPPALGYFKLENYAAMALAVLFGREEADPDDPASDVTVPTEVVDKLLKSFRDMLDGKNPGSPVNMCQCILCLSISDGNTLALVNSSAISETGMPCGLLDSIALALNQGADVVEQRNSFMHYDITMAREYAAAVLLNLALSDQTVGAVLAHDDVKKGIDNALGDSAHLTTKATKRLKDTLFRLQLVTEDGAQAVKQRREAAIEGTRDERQIMLSYCWSQQETVLRIRGELGQRRYKIWIDVEQMQGSTVDSTFSAQYWLHFYLPASFHALF